MIKFAKRNLSSTTKKNEKQEFKAQTTLILTVNPLLGLIKAFPKPQTADHEKTFDLSGKEIVC